MSEPRAKYPADSTFGRRIKEMAEEKQKVAKRIVETFLVGGGSTFISDGSSTLYVGLAIFQEAFRRGSTAPFEAEIYTNNLAIAHEYPLWDTPKGKLPGIRVYSTEGTVESDLTMLCGDAANDCVTNSVKRVQFLILSIRAIVGQYGAAGKEAESLRIKQNALRHGSEDVQAIIFVADHKKLSESYNKSLPLIYPVQKQWESLVESENTYIVSTRHPDVDPLMQHPSRPPKSETDWYLVNRGWFKAIMQDRLIEV
jgi:DeoR/GlpR family transcriptional regulator of sugar metabolism